MCNLAHSRWHTRCVGMRAACSASASRATCRFFRSIDWVQLQAGQTPSPLRLDDINDFGPKSTSRSKAQVLPPRHDIVGSGFVSVVLFLLQAVLDDTGKKPAEGLGVENAFKDFDFSRAAMSNYEANAI
jgi:hypothetical protein